MESKNCNLCGKCNLRSAAYLATRRETLGPRFKAALAKQNTISKIFFTDLLEGSAKLCCPAKIDVDEDVIEMRAAAAKESQETEFCKELLKNFQETGNPVGAPKKHKKYRFFFG